MAFESGQLSGAQHYAQAGAEQSQLPEETAEDLEWDDAEEASTTLAEPDTRT